MFYCIDFMKAECKECGLCYYVDLDGVFCRKYYKNECDSCGECYKYR